MAIENGRLRLDDGRLIPIVIGTSLDDSVFLQK